MPPQGGELHRGDWHGGGGGVLSPKLQMYGGSKHKRGGLYIQEQQSQKPLALLVKCSMVPFLCRLRSSTHQAQRRNSFAKVLQVWIVD